MSCFIVGTGWYLKNFGHFLDLPCEDISALVYPAALFWLELELARAAFSLLTAGGDAGPATW